MTEIYAENVMVREVGNRRIANLGTYGYGYTAYNGGQASVNSQFYINAIQILQFNGGTYDTYTLVNPKITMFKPDELDYGAADISTIKMTFQYENAN